MSTLQASVAARESGPLITLSRAADVTPAARLSELITGQLPAGTRHLTTDAAWLSYADSMSIRVLVPAAEALKQRGGGMVLLRPQGRSPGC